MAKFNLDVNYNNDYVCICSPGDEDFEAHVIVELTNEDIRKIHMMQRLC